VAIDFPELKLLGIHIGIPWTDEMISMAWKHENVFIGVDAYAPGRFILGIAAGDTAVFQVGLKSARLAEMEHAFA